MNSGPLGFKIQPCSGDAFGKEGVFVSKITREEVPTAIVQGVVLLEINGEKVREESYDKVFCTIKTVGRWHPQFFMF